MNERHSAATLAAVGFLAYYVVVMWHEVAGHGLAFYLLGAHHFILTSTSMSSADKLPGFAEGTMGRRFVLAAGSLSTIFLGLVLYPLVRLAFRRNVDITFRLFLWLTAAVCIFHGFAYLVFSGLSGVGDWSGVIKYWPHQTLLRVIEVAAGTLACGVVVRSVAPLFGKFPGNLTQLALIPYVCSTLIFCLAGLRVPNGAYLMLISVVPAGLVGQAMLLFIAPVARRLRPQIPPPGRVPVSPTAIALAAVFVVIILATAPGVHFTVP